MGVWSRIEDELIDKLFEEVKRHKEEKVKNNSFTITWDTVRDEYEAIYGRDRLYKCIWLDDKFVEKIILSEIRKYPESREFLQKVYIFAKTRMGEEFDKNKCLNFVRILYCNLLYCDEFSQKMIRIRQDWESGCKVHYERENLGIESAREFLLEETESEKKILNIENMNIVDIYSDNYTEVMFMQKAYEVPICLKDIYIENDFDIILGNYSPKGLLSYINDFCYGPCNYPILFIEGHAGIGKSSLISKIAYEYRKNETFAGRKLAIIQLRNLAKADKTLDIFNPWSDFKRYLKFEGTVKEFFYLLDKYVLILDGFDELCLVDNIRLKNKLHYVANILKRLEDYQCECKIIMTTRPNYLARKSEWNVIYQNPIVIQLRHFSVLKRIEWMENAKKAGLKIASNVEKSLATSMQNDVEVVASTPLTLYLVAHENIVISKNDELWSVYQNIFGKEIMRKRYDHLNLDNEIIEHPGYRLFELIYDITKEIAYYMYCCNKMDIFWEEIKLCIEMVIGKEDIQQYYNNPKDIKNIRNLLKDSYALFNYYKETELSGGIAFYHNYIREFFVQEKLYEELEKIYLKSTSSKQNGINYSRIKENLLGKIEKGRLSDKTIDFLASHSRALQNGLTWCRLENKLNCIKEIITDMILESDSIGYDENVAFNLWMIRNIVNSIYNEKDNNGQIKPYNVFEHERIINSKKNNNLNQYLELISKYCDIFNINFEGIELKGRELKNIVFNKCNLHKAVLSGGCIEKVRFIECEMREIQLNGSVLREVNFEQCKIESGNFRGAEMTIGNMLNCLISGCKFQGAKMVRILFDKTDIENAVLNGSDFVQAEIKDYERILENVSSFEYANMDNLKWNNDNMREQFYNKLKEQKNMLIE